MIIESITIPTAHGTMMEEEDLVNLLFADSILVFPSKTALEIISLIVQLLYSFIILLQVQVQSHKTRFERFW